MSLWELIKKIVDAFLSFFRARKEERQQVAVEEASKVLEVDKDDREEVSRVRDEIRRDVEEAGGDSESYRRSFERLRRELGDEE